MRAHIFLCMLAYYVEWHMLEAWRERLFSDEDQGARQICDPVAPTARSERALRKVHVHNLKDGTEVESVRTLPEDQEPTFTMTTTPNGHQHRALDSTAATTMRTESRTSTSV